MYFQHFIIGIKLVLISIMNCIHKIKRILLYYFIPRKRDWVNWDSKLFQRDTELLEHVFQIEEIQVFYVPKYFTRSNLEYYMSCYSMLIEDC